MAEISFEESRLKWRIFLSKLCQVLKLVLPELTAYLITYFVLNLIYRYVEPQNHDDEKEKSDSEDIQKTDGNFTQVVKYLSVNLKSMSRDLTFLLGFYVSSIAKRWYDQLRNLPYPDNLAMYLNGVVSDNETTHFKMTILRYALVSWTLCLSQFSTRLAQKFPDLATIRTSRLLNQEEVTKLLQWQDDCNWIRPLNWAANLVKRAKQLNLIGSDAKEIWRELARFKNQLQLLVDLNSNPLPFVYKTVVVTAVYSYLILSVVGEQDIGNTHIQLYFPLFGALKVVFFVGWLKAALAMENPLKTDFDLDVVFDRNYRLFPILFSESEFYQIVLRNESLKKF